MVSKAQNRATAKYKKANYKRVSLEIPKDQTETLKAVSAAIGESVNGFIKRAIREKIKADAESNGMQPDQYIAEAIKALHAEDQHAEDQHAEIAEDQTAEDQHTEMDAETAGKPQDEKKPRQPMRLS